MPDTTAPRGSLQLPPAFAAATTNPYGLADVGDFASPSLVDIDADGDLDALIGNYDGNTLVHLNTGSASAPVFGTASTNPYGLANVGNYAKKVNSPGTIQVSKGEKLGHFAYGGSTVITLIEQGIKSVTIPQGQQIGVFQSKASPK